MLVSMKDILVHASKNNYAVAAPNVGTELDARAAIEVAEEINSPIILDVGFGANADINFYGHMLADLARQSRVPVAINLDHGGSFEQCVAAVRAQFTSVMIDRSAESYEKNVADTAEVVKMAHAVGVSVEAELGHVGQGSNAEEDTKSHLTEPEEAKKFIEETGVDMLAVAIGTAHGAYPKGFVPKLDYERLDQIKAAVGQDFPLVLHGSSGAPDDALKHVCSHGINKVNIANDLCNAITANLNALQLEGQAAYGVWTEIVNGFKGKLRHMMVDIYCSAGQAWTVAPEGLTGTLESMEEK